MRIASVLLLWGAICASAPIALSSSLMPLAPVEAQTEATRPSRAPQLLEATTTNNRVRSRYAQYRITLASPADAQPIEAIQIQQRSGTEAIQLRLDQTRVWVNGAAWAIASHSGNGHTEPLILTFADPIPPNSAIVLQLRPHYNPRWGGEYSYGITVLMAEDFSLYLGPARLRFYEGDRRIWFP
ncbi:DUF2808 domain-containing protein [Spirulina sp. CCNP1310]|uniref:DUF2808 domain-containing protein n=1 Tax=Spirulina sp. CCNP1310 TaxID=3110249 RepID=UPI002B1F3FEB|nr:DUF2808 domain-containing protein [Spirulina sp. CCNP1310]